jgi:hypothetical protein
MLAVIARPYTASEWTELRGRRWGALVSGLFCLGIVGAALVGLVVLFDWEFAGWRLDLWSQWGSVFSALGGAVALTLVLLLSGQGVLSSWTRWQRETAVLRHGQALVVTIEAEAVAAIEGKHRAWAVLAVDAQHVLALPLRQLHIGLWHHPGVPPSGWPVVWELVLTGLHQDVLSARCWGQSRLPQPAPLPLHELLEPAEAVQRGDWLDRGQLWPGTIDTLLADVVYGPDGARELADLRQPMPSAWHGLNQARLEEALGQAFGAGRWQAEFRTRLPHVDDYVDWLTRHGPATGVRLQPCVRQFRQVQTALHQLTGVPHGRLRPKSELEPLVPRHQRHLWWERFQDAVGQPLPRLGVSSLPGWVYGLALLTGVVTIAGYARLLEWCQVQATQWQIQQTAWFEALSIGAMLLATLVFCVTFAGVVRLARPWRRFALPGSIRTLGDLAYWLALRTDTARTLPATAATFRPLVQRALLRRPLMIVRPPMTRWIDGDSPW